MGIKIFAGEQVWAEMIAQRNAQVPASVTRPGCFQSEALCRFQTARYQAGFLEAELVPTIYGWSVRSATGLDNFQILAGVRSGMLDGSREAAERWAWSWFNDDPTRRVVFERS